MGRCLIRRYETSPVIIARQRKITGRGRGRLCSGAEVGVLVSQRSSEGSEVHPPVVCLEADGLVIGRVPSEVDVRWRFLSRL